MKKVKFSLMYLAAIAAISSAFAMRPAVICDNQPQYHWDGSMYHLLGEFGVDYDCDWSPAVTCTFYRPNPISQPNTYAGCKLGTFIDLGARIKAKK